MNEDNSAQETSADTFTPITTQEDLNKALGDRLGRERAKFSDYDELKAQAGKFAQWEQSQKSEQEKLQEQLSSLTKERDDTKSKAERLEVIALEGIPADYHDLVHGDTPETLAASAKKVKLLINSNAEAKGKPNVSYSVNLDGDGSDQHALNGDGLEQALKNKLGIK